MQNAIVAKMSQLPALLRQTLTWDQGKEMSNHAQIAEALDLEIYFCDPHSPPWQRGTNENTNGLLRQWFPKGTDLSVFPPEDYLDYVAAKLNNRPRKTLGWKNTRPSTRRTTVQAVRSTRCCTSTLNPPAIRRQQPSLSAA